MQSADPLYKPLATTRILVDDGDVDRWVALMQVSRWQEWAHAPYTLYICVVKYSLSNIRLRGTLQYASRKTQT